MVTGSGVQLEISSGGYRAVVTESGASLRLLEHDGRPLVLGWEEAAMSSSGRGQLLAPWPNRIRDGRYSFQGRDLQLPLSEPARGNASHGLVRWVSWTVQEQGGDSVTLRYRLMGQPGYPWVLDLQVTYSLSPSGLTVRFCATNRAGSPAPYALGAHPYLTTGTGPVDRWELTLPVREQLLVDDRLIPTGRSVVAGTDLDFRGGRTIGATRLDTAFTGLDVGQDGRTTVTLRDPERDEGVELWMDGQHHWVQVFTGDSLPLHARESLAVEPMTSPPDAFNSGTDLLVLAAAGSPGDEHTATWGITAR